MERLKERAFAPGSLEAEAGELLRASEPYAVPPSLKRRVRERLVEGRSRSWLPVLLRPVLIGAGLLLVVGAAAAVGRAVLRHPESAPAAAPPSAAPAVPVAAPAPGVPAASQSNGTGAPELEPDAPPVTVSPGAAGAERRAPAERAAAERAADPSAPSEATLVYGAAKALRSSGDPSLAAKLLDDYARRYPHGALSEEALALSIDVAVARGDGRAKQLATRYLARYPRGHFQAKAERVLAQ